MEKIMEILKKLRPDVDFEAEKALIDGGILSSFDILNLIEELSDAYDIDIETDDIIPENLNSAEGIYRLMQRLLTGEERK
mgnify:CR=1 FL=1